MIDESIEPTERQIGFMNQLVEQNIRVAGDVVEIAANTWAIHGVIPVDGDVIVAEFGSYDDARVALSRLSTDGIDASTVSPAGGDDVRRAANGGVVP
jgi:hypothetical protein